MTPIKHPARHVLVLIAMATLSTEVLAHGSEHHMGFARACLHFVSAHGFWIYMLVVSLGLIGVLASSSKAKR